MIGNARIGVQVGFRGKAPGSGKISAIGQACHNAQMEAARIRTSHSGQIAVSAAAMKGRVT